MEILLIVLLNLFSALTFLPLLKHEHWLVRIWDYPRKQILVLHLPIFIGAVLLLPFENYYLTISMGISAAALIFISTRIFPYTKLKSKQIKSAQSLKNSISILVSNVEMKNSDYQTLCGIIKKEKADIVLLLEADEEWQIQISEIESIYPFRHLLPLGNTYGMLLYSKVEFQKPEFRYLVNDDIPSFRANIELANKQLIHFYGVHPEPPFPTQSTTTVERDAEILKIGREIASLDKPVIVAGDLNDVAWSRTTRLFQKVSRLLDPRIGRGFYSTFHARHFWARWPLDHIFVSKHFEVIEMKRLPYMGSDHFPIKIDVSLNYSQQNESVEAINLEEKMEVKEKIEKA